MTYLKFWTTHGNLDKNMRISSYFLCMAFLPILQGFFITIKVFSANHYEYSEIIKIICPLLYKNHFTSLGIFSSTLSSQDCSYRA